MQKPCLSFLPMSPCSCISCGISVGEKFYYLDVTMVLLMQMDELVFINSDSYEVFYQGGLTIVFGE